MLNAGVCCARTFLTWVPFRPAHIFYHPHRPPKAYGPAASLVSCRTPLRGIGFNPATPYNPWSRREGIHHLSVECTIDYPMPIGVQYSNCLNSMVPEKVISARSFIRDPLDRIPLQEAAKSRLRGLPEVLSSEALILWDSHSILTTLRHENEFATHKKIRRSTWRSVYYQPPAPAAHYRSSSRP